MILDLTNHIAVTFTEEPGLWLRFGSRTGNKSRTCDIKYILAMKRGQTGHS